MLFNQGCNSSCLNSNFSDLTFNSVFLLARFRLKRRARDTVARAWPRCSAPTGSSMFSPLSVDTSPLSWWLARRWASALWTPDTRPLLSSLLMLWRDSQVQIFVTRTEKAECVTLGPVWAHILLPAVMENKGMGCAVALLRCVLVQGFPAALVLTSQTLCN